MAKTDHKNALPIPEAATAGADANQVLSAWIVNGQLHLSAQRAFEKPELWGMMLMDIAKHASNIYAQQGVMTQPQAMTRILSVLSKHTGGAMDSGQTTIL